MRAKPTSQHRSEEKRDRILEAMDVLLRRKSFAEISVAELAAKANVASATIYQRFSNTDATASVLMELYFRKVEEWARRPARRERRSKPLFQALLTVANDAHDQVTALGYVMRPAYLYSRHRPDRAGSEWARLEQVALDGFKAFLRQRSAQIRVRDTDEAATILCRLFNFMLLAPLLHGDELRRSNLGSRKQFADSLATLAYRYLRGGEQPVGV